MSDRTGAPQILRAVVIAMGCVCGTGVRAEPQTLPAEVYQRAEKLLHWNFGSLVYRASITPHWIGESDAFWYANTTPDGVEWVRIDAKQRRYAAFDAETLAATLSRATGTDYSPSRLPFDAFEYQDGLRSIRFAVQDQRWDCATSGKSCRAAEGPAVVRATELASPDGRWAAFVRGRDVLVRSLETGAEIALTTDGADDFDYSGRAFLDGTDERFQKRNRPPKVAWSHDSRRLLVEKFDRREVRQATLVQHAPPDGGPPRVHSYRYPLPGDSVIGWVAPQVIDLATRARMLLQVGPFPSVNDTLLGDDRMWWSADDRRIYALGQSRGLKSMTLHEIDAVTGQSRVVIEERSDSYVLANLARWPANVRDLNGGREILWFSERDGWAHLYLYDTLTGRVKRQVTEGPWVVRDVLFVDEETRWVYFTAGGRELGRNPYYRHLYRARLDGPQLELLTPEDADHTITFSPTRRTFVDTYSRIDSPPVSVLRGAGGKLLRELERADTSRLWATGFRQPEPFVVKARDGVTPLYGVLYRPSDFDPAQRYPVLDSIYGGPQVLRTATTFSVSPMQEWAIAELGFIVVALDGLGTPFRSRAFRDVSYRHLEDAGGLADHVAALKQLAERHPYMDLGRVGAYGGSAGGYAAVRAMLEYPELFKVGVAYSGNHDSRIYYASWAERYLGLPPEADYVTQANITRADRLAGKLLLAHGDIDDNVLPAQTLALADAFIAANKDFDLLIMPNRAHGLTNDPYFDRRLWDYLVANLMGRTPPPGYRMQPRP